MSTEPFGLVSTLTTNLYFNKDNTNRLLVGTGKSEALKFATYNGQDTVVDMVNLDSSANQVNLLVPTNISTSLVVKGVEASIDTEASSALNIGASSSTINIGNENSVVNIKGTVNSVQTTNTEIKDALLTLNKGGAVATAAGSGLEFEEDGSSTGYMKISTDRKSYDFKAPAQSTVTSLDNHGIQVFSDDTKATTVMAIKEQMGKVVFTTDGHPSVHLDLDHEAPCDIVTTLGAQNIQGVKTFVDNTVVISTTNPASLTDSAALAVSGGATIAKKLYVGQEADFASKVQIADTLDVTGQATLNGGMTLNGSLNLNADLTVAGSAQFNSGITADAQSTLFNTKITGALESTGEALFTGLHQVDGPAIFNNATTINNTLNVTEQTTFGGVSHFGSDVSITGDLSMPASAITSGTLTANTVTASNTLTAGNIYGSGDFVSSLFIDGVKRSELKNVSTGVSQTKKNADNVVVGDITLTDSTTAINRYDSAGQLVSYLSVNDSSAELKSAGVNIIGDSFTTISGASDLTMKTASYKASVMLNDSVINTYKRNDQNMIVGGNSIDNAETTFTRSDADGNLKAELRLKSTGDVVLSSKNLSVAMTDSASLTAKDLSVVCSESVDVMASQGITFGGSDVSIQQNASVVGNMSVSGTTTMSLDAECKEKLVVSSTYNPSSLTDSAALAVSGGATIAKKLYVGQDTDIGAGLRVQGDSVMAGQLDVTSSGTFGGVVTVNNDTNPASLSSVAALKTTGGAVVQKKLFVGEKITASSDLEVAGLTRLNQGMELTGDFTATGDVDVTGNTALNGSLTVTQNAILSSNLSVAQNTTLSGSLTVTNNTTISGGDLAVSGDFDANSATIRGSISGRTLLVSEGSELQGDLHVSGDATVDGKAVVNSDLIFKGPKFEGGVFQATGVEQNNAGIWCKDKSYKDSQKKGLFVTESDGIRILDQTTGSVVISCTSTDNQNEGQIGIDQGKVALRHYYNTVDDSSAGNTTSGVVCIDNTKNVFNRYDKDAKLRSQLFQDDSMHAVYKFDSSSNLKGGLTLEDEKSLLVRSTAGVLNSKVELNNDGTLKAVAQNQIEVTAPIVTISGVTTVTGDATFASPVECQSTAVFNDDVTFSNPSKTFTVSSNTAFGGKVGLSSVLNPGNSSDVAHAAFYCAGGAIVEKDFYANGTVYNPTTQLMAISSDKRVKEQIVDADLDDCLKSINSIKLRNFNYTAAYAEQSGVKQEAVQLGVIADEFLMSHPDSVIVKDEVKVGEASFKNFKTVNLSRQLYELIGCVQRLTQRVQELESKQ